MLTLSSCTGTGGSKGGVVYYTNFTAGYAPRSLAAFQPLLVETYGAPTEGATSEQLNEATVQALRNHGPTWMPRNYTGDPAAAQSAYRLRIAYAAPKSLKLDELCKGTPSYPPAAGTEEEPSSRTLASVCRGETAIAYGEGSPGSSPDINGAGFQRFVGLFGREIMPRHNPVTEDDCLFRNCD